MPAVTDALAPEAAFVQAYGTDNQYERLLSGLLPESELLGLARWELYRPFAGFERWMKLEARDVHDTRTCHGVIDYSTRKPDSLTHDEWAVFKKITNAVSAANAGPLAQHGVQATVELVEHVGHCRACNTSAYGRSASIRMTWEGRPLSREYTLEGEP